MADALLAKQWITDKSSAVLSLSFAVLILLSNGKRHLNNCSQCCVVGEWLKPLTNLYSQMYQNFVDRLP